MRKSFLLSILLLVTLSVRSQPAEPAQSPEKVQAGPLYPDTNEGFRSQLDAIVRQYRAGDAAAGRHLIDQLRLPHSEEWFSEHLGPAQSAQLSARYDRLFANFAESLEKTIESIVANRSASLLTQLDAGNGETPSYILPEAKTSGIVSVKQPRLFYGHFAIQVHKKDSVSWADSFTYEDGVFRFVGFGAWPFWAWEAGSEGAAPKGGSFTQPAIRVSRGPEIYPSPATANRTEGVVALRLRIDKQGRVIKADVLNGDPSLTQAAVDIARQWRYKPATLGGQIIESEVNADIHFKFH